MSVQINDGGPAHPTYTGSPKWHHQGMTLRDWFRDQLAAARQRETVAIASWDEERGRALREGARVVEWQARAERAEAELARLRADNYSEDHGTNSRGMTLRDWFAGQALAGLRSGNAYASDELAAKLAYNDADAMIAARKGRP